MDKQDTVFCGNLSEKVTKELLYELFLQAGPITNVNILKDAVGKSRGFGFITFKHEISVPYAIQLISGETLFNRMINVKPRTNADSPATSGPRSHYTPHRQQDSGGSRGGDSSRRNGSSSTSDHRGHSFQLDSRRRSVDSRSSSSSYSRQASHHGSSHSSAPSTPHIPQNMYATTYPSPQQPRHFGDSSPLAIFDPLLEERVRAMRMHAHLSHRALQSQQPYYRDNRRY